MIRSVRAGAGALAMLLCATAMSAQAKEPAPEPSTPTAGKPLTPEQAAAAQEAFVKSLHPQNGDITVGPARAKLHLGDHYYFLGPDEARRVIVDAWGNPPQAADDVLGLVMPAGKTPFDKVWGAVVTWEASGHVPDKDADSEDYNSVLQSARESAAASNEERRKAGYPTLELVGWAQPPQYDHAQHSLIWARDIRFDGEKVDTLNYDVRLLGREGILSLNMIADMEHLGEVREAAKSFGAAAEFVPGARYADYNSSTDKTAEYGLAGVVAAGLGVAAAKKLGFLAIVLGFGKKLIVLLVAAGAAIMGFFRRLFGRKSVSEGDEGTI